MSDAEAHNARILEIKRVLKERDQARADGNYGRSDTLRDQLVGKFAIEIVDQNAGPSGFKFKDGSSTKLDKSVAIPAGALSSGKKRARDDEEAPSSNTKKTRDEKPATKAAAGAAAAGEKKKKPSTASLPSSSEKSRNAAVAAAIVGSSGSARTVQGVLIDELQIGSGTQARVGKRIKVHYVGKLKNGKVFDSSSKKPFTFRLGAGEVIRGWDIGCDGMLVGGKRKLTIPPEKAYGKSGAPPTIPPNSTLIFEVTLLDVM